MTNFRIYQKTLSFSLMMFLCDLLSLAIIIGFCVAGFYIGDRNAAEGAALVGLASGLLIGIIASVLINYLLVNRIKAGQIAMIAKGVTEDTLPDHTFRAGMNEVKGRFGKITVFFFVTNAIRNIFRRIGRGFTRLGSAVGGKVGGGIASAIDSAVQTVISYLVDCCLGWIMFRTDKGAASAACEGCVIFFKHGKALVKNLGRIFGIGLLAFIVFGGASFGILYLIFSQFPNLWQSLSQEIIEAGGTSEFAGDPKALLLVAAAFFALILYSFLQKVFVRPFILVGVMRNFMEAGKAHLPTEQEMDDVERKFPRFSRLRNKLD